MVANVLPSVPACNATIWSASLPQVQVVLWRKGVLVIPAASATPGAWTA